jgi:energy-coupling factor transport system substrate-specific component
VIGALALISGRAGRLVAGLALALLLVPAAVRAIALPAGGGSPAASSIAAAAHRAAAYLKRVENRDGGFGEAPGQRSSALFSGWAALGLASNGVQVAALRRSSSDPTLLQYLQHHAGAADSGSLERTILALRAGGASVTSVGGHDLASELSRHFSRQGAVGKLVNLTAFGVLALCAADQPSAAALEDRAAGWLAGQSNRDGGYGFAGRGSQSDADDTGAVLEALRCATGGTDQSATAIIRARHRAVAYLRRDQDRDGGFPAAPGAGSNAQSTAWAIQGLIAAGVSPSTLRRDEHTPLGYLVGLVSRSGAVRYARGQSVTPVWVTGEALLALTGTALPLVAPTTAVPAFTSRG